MNKKIILILVMALFLSNAAIAQEKGADCVQINDYFNKTNHYQSSEAKNLLVNCNDFCENVDNYPNARDYCGIDSCKVQAADGTVSPWCCKMARIWGSKTGAYENPLESIVDDCKKSATSQDDVLYCINDLRVNSKMSPECCKLAPKINNYDNTIGTNTMEYCSNQKVARACVSNFERTHKINKACCEYAETHNNKFSGTDLFRNSPDLAESLESAVSECHTAFAQEDSDKISCLRNLSKTKKLSSACCPAFNNGTLKPTKKIPFIALDMYCNPENYNK